MKQNSTVCIVGVFPPPVHGLAMVNDIMKSHILKRSPDSYVFSLSPKSISRSIFNKIFRLLKVFIILPKFIIISIMHKYSALYIGLSGGYGQFYDLLFILIAKMTNKSIFIHHHSFSYLNKKNLITSLILKLSAKRCVHIALCDRMEQKLKNYNPAIECRILSNVFFLDNSDQLPREKNSPNTLGFLGNISFDKGIREFYDVFSKLTEDTNIKGIIAGPCQDSKSKNFINEIIQQNDSISYIGEVNITEKTKFFKSIDIFLMPSSLEEAEPLVIHEALSFGVPVIANAKGCIPEMLSLNSGVVVNNTDQFISEAVSQIGEWINNPDKYNFVKIAASKCHNSNKKLYQNVLEDLILEIT